MSLFLIIFIVIATIWLYLKYILVEVPSIRVVLAMKKLPGPKGLPFLLGDVISLVKMDAQGILVYANKLKRLYPRLAAAYIAGIPNILLQRPDDIKHILSSNTNIKKGKEYEPIIPWLNEGLLTSYGIKWHARRKMLTPTFHFKILDDALSGMSKKTEVLIDRLTQTEGSNVMIEDYITRYTLDVMAETAMGVQLNLQTDTGNQYLKCVKTASQLIVERVLSVFQLRDGIYKLTSKYREFSNAVKTLHNFTDNVIAKRKESGDSILNDEDEDAFGQKRRKAFLDCLIAMQRDNPESFTDYDIREEVDTFTFEGHDTTSAALCFCLWLLGGHPDVQKNVYNEIEEIIGDNELTMANIQSLNYLEKVIKETLRLYPSVPYISRRLVEDVYLDDETVLPSTANVIMVPYIVHRDIESFPDPEKFDPERFSEEASRGRHPYAYIPFSAGPRNCVGQKFAMLEMKVTVVSVIRKFKIESITKREDFDILPHLIVRPTNPLECKFIHRI